MHRRVFLALLLAGCAGAPARSQPIAPTDVPTGAMTFDEWLRSFRPRAIAAGLSSGLVDRELVGLTPDDRVSRLDSSQPEFSRPVSVYIKNAISNDRIALGRRKRSEVAAFSGIEQRFGVPRDILIAIWAQESGFGAIQGDMDVIRCMATLAADGRRRAWAEGELIAALKVIQSGEFTRSRLRGSWAGAMGQTQFIPSTFLSTAVDGDGDRKRDIWTSSADALASAANLLAKAGWKRGESWAREVTAPAGFDFSLTEGPKQTPSWWDARGVKRADRAPWSSADQVSPAQLIAPSGAGGPLFLLFPNHFAIRAYNNSTAYALAVGMLADRFAGMGPLVKAWPEEIPLALNDRIAAQRALAALGFDPGQPDGV
ncbi:MAG TPA: lytic murein transglycosylase, partial [Phenylobacterium sp.]